MVHCRARAQTFLSQDLAIERVLFGAQRVAHAPMWDNGRPQPPGRWAEAARFAADALERDPEARVLIHCQKGRRRSVLVAYAVLRLRGRSPEEAARLILSHRDVARLVPAYRASVEAWLAAGARPPTDRRGNRENLGNRSRAGGARPLRGAIMLVPVSKNRVTVSIDRLRQRIGQRPEGAGPLPSDARSCPRCQSHYGAEEMRRNLRVCATCGHHFPVSARERLDQLAGSVGWGELWPELRASDPLQFFDLQAYPDRLRSAEASSGLGEAMVVADLQIVSEQCVGAVMDFAFMGGSMGAVVGEKLARAAERAIDRGVPLVVVTASGGARMQEGVLSLMQMAKTVVALEMLADERLPVIVVLGHPTTGGVWASFAALGDVTYAEPGALIAFSGPRVIEQTTREKLPPDFGRAETQLYNGQIDAVLDRRELAARIGRVLGILRRPALELGPAPAMQWAQERADRAARVAQALPGLSRRILERVVRGQDGPGEEPR